jgi:hypothetical protein
MHSRGERNGVIRTLDHSAGTWACNPSTTASLPTHSLDERTVWLEVPARLARRLLRLAKRHGHGNQNSLSLVISREELALYGPVSS